MNAKLLESLDVFVDTVKTGSFSSVARQRGLAASSVARQIDTLEKELQTALFTRSTRSLTPTKAGELLFHRATQILEDLTKARREVTSFAHEVQGVLQISCFPTFGRRYVLPSLSPLAQKFPQLRIELDLTESLIAPTAERQDVAIRFGEQPDSSLVANRIGSQRYVVCASPAYLANHQSPRDSHELVQHKLIDKRHRASALGWREVLGVHRAERMTYALECDDFEAQRLAALASLGIARLPDWVVGPDIQQGSLVEMLLEDIPRGKESGIYLLRALSKPCANVKVFTECLQALIGSPPLWLCK